MVEEDDVAGLLAAEVVSFFEHLLHDIPVADLSPHHAAAGVLNGLFEARIAHYGGDERVFVQRPLPEHRDGAYREHAVSVDHIAPLVHRYAPVPVPVEREPYIGAGVFHGFAHLIGIQGAAVVVDVLAVRLYGYRYHLRAELVEYRRRHAVGRAVGAVHRYLEPVEGKLLRERGLREDHVPAYGVIDPVGLPDLARRGPVARVIVLEYEVLYAELHLIRELEPVP